MKKAPSLVVIAALKAAVFLLSIWTITAETVHSKESALIREAGRLRWDLQGLSIMLIVTEYFTTAFLEFPPLNSRLFFK